MVFETFPHLENGQILIRPMAEGDLPFLRQLTQEESVYRYEPTFLAERQSADLGEFISSGCAKLLADKESILLGVYSKKDASRFVGIAELYGYVEERNKMSIGYRLLPSFWHQGLGTQIVSLLKDYLLNEEGIKKITAHVRVENIASKKCLIHNGFVQRRAEHLEDWGFPEKVKAVKYVYYADLKGHGAL